MATYFSIDWKIQWTEEPGGLQSKGLQGVGHDWVTEDTHICVWVRIYTCVYASVQFSRSVISDSLWPHGLEHTRLPCPSPAPGVYWNSCLLCGWCHSTSSSSVILFSSCFQSFPASRSFKWVNSLHQAAKVLEFQLQHQSFHWIFRTDFL